ncbi:MAG: carbonic anhydrase [Phycisphaerae bacterium]|nr:carbonic anhydrase [Phycisphaerae bacterium]
MTPSRTISARSARAGHLLLVILIPGLLLAATWYAPGMSNAERAITPDEALKQLLEGNQRYIDGQMRSHDHTADRKKLATGQSPSVIILRCADSRVAPEIIFDQNLGELFVCGVAGNTPTTEIVASMEYAVSVLGSCVIVVMGHSSCGALDAAIDNFDDVDELPGNLPTLVSRFLPAVMEAKEKDGDLLTNAIRVNALMSAEQLPRMSTILQQAVKKGELKVVGGVYDLSTGRFTLVD